MKRLDCRILIVYVIFSIMIPLQMVKIVEVLVAKGGIQLVKPEGFFVDGSEGPITAGELERAAV